MPDRTVKQAITGNENTDPSKSAQGIGPDPRGRNENPAAIENPRKRLFFNGSSYSGADIKVLVHKYQSGPANIIQQLESAIGIYSEVQSTLDTLYDSALEISRSKYDFLLGDIGRAEYDERLNLLWKQPAQKILRAEGELPDNVNYHQFVGKRVLELYLVAQQSKSTQFGYLDNELASALDRLQSELTSLIEGWKQQKAAIETKKESGAFVQTKTLAELQTLSISTYREKSPVRGFGRSNPSGWVRGQRTIAGSMIFTVFDRDVLWSLLDFDPSDFDGDNKFKAAILDQLPPLDITIQFANEYGSLSRMTIYGVEFISEGKTMSIEDIFLENTVQYIARDVDPMTPVLTEDGRPYSEVLTAYNQAVAHGRRPDRPIRASDLIGSDWGRTSNEENSAETRFKNRYNPFY